MLVVLGLLVPTRLSRLSAIAQSSRTEEDRSLNQTALHPEALSGIWETPNGDGGAVGIHLQLATTLPNDSRVPWASQAWQDLEVGVFERKMIGAAFGAINGFSDSKRGGALYKDGRLVLHYSWLGKDPVAIDLDLSLEANGCWHGRFHRNSFDRVVSLCRPASSDPVQPSPLAGTWSQTSDSEMQCVHIVQTGRDTFMGWSDFLQIPGKLSYSPKISAPHDLYEYYGSLVKVERFSSGIVRVGFGAYDPICCPHDFLGKLDADDSIITGNYNSSPVTFARTRSDSCVH